MSEATSASAGAAMDRLRRPVHPERAAVAPAAGREPCSGSDENVAHRARIEALQEQPLRLLVLLPKAAADPVPIIGDGVQSLLRLLLAGIGRLDVGAQR